MRELGGKMDGPNLEPVGGQPTESAHPGRPISASKDGGPGFVLVRKGSSCDGASGWIFYPQ